MPEHWPRAVGLTGPNAAGKGEVAHFLVDRGYTYHSLSDVVRAEAAARDLPPSRANLVEIGNDLRRRGGAAALVKCLTPRLRLPAIIDSVRNPAEVEELRRLEGFVLLTVTAPDALRFERIRARGRVGDVSTVEEFRANEQRENSAVAGEQRIGATVALADATVVNDTTLAALCRRVEEALDRLAC